MISGYDYDNDYIYIYIYANQVQEQVRTLRIVPPLELRCQ